MKVCFVQKQAFPYFGVMSLAGRLGASGIETDSVIANLEADPVRTLKGIAPDLIGFSALSTEHDWLRRTAASVKAAFPDVPVVAGGIHAILHPEAVLALPGVDFVCTGEGEATLPALCSALASGGSPRGIRGIGYRENGRPVVNQREPLLADLNGPAEDRMVYYRRYPTLQNDELKQFIASRGCPYDCSFCANGELHRLFPGGNRVRLKDPGHLLAEIESARAAGPLRRIFFADDLFAANKGWLREFAPAYHERIGVPYMCVTRADHMDEETARLLQASGCHTVSFGVESGNQRIRARLLNKRISDDTLARCARILHENGIRVQTSTMFCLPDETLDDAISSVELNIRLGADFVFTPLFLPFPGTPLAAYCVKKGYLPGGFTFDRLPQSFLTHSVLDLPDRRRIENLQRVAYFLVMYPPLLRLAGPLIRRVTAKCWYAPFLFLGTFLRYKAERGLSFRGTCRYLWRFKKSF